jgi:aspartate kinase
MQGCPTLLTLTDAHHETVDTIPTVIKFGGTSVEDASAFRRVTKIVRANESARVVVVVSAMSGVTDALLWCVQAAAGGDAEGVRLSFDGHLARHLNVARALLARDEVTAFELSLESTRREIVGSLEALVDCAAQHAPLQDEIISHGERLSALLTAAILRSDGLPAKYVDTRCCITTDDEYGCATPLFEETKHRTRDELVPLVESSTIPVLGGFIGASKGGTTTTLGRGGSDYSAAIIGTALCAREVQIWTDVPGIMTGDPRIVENARTIACLSYAEAVELSRFGAKVLHPKAALHAAERRIPMRILNSRAPMETGTTVCADAGGSPFPLKGVTHKTGVTTVHVKFSSEFGSNGLLPAALEIIGRCRAVAYVVAQSDAGVSVSLDGAVSLPVVIEELKHLGDVNVEEARAILCLVGEGLLSAPSTAARILRTALDINMSLINQDAPSVSLLFLADEDKAAEAVCRIHEEFL